jgi:hypothetical protein
VGREKVSICQLINLLVKGSRSMSKRIEVVKMHYAMFFTHDGKAIINITGLFFLSFALSKRASRIRLAPTGASGFKKRTQEHCSVGLRTIQSVMSNEGYRYFEPVCGAEKRNSAVQCGETGEQTRGINRSTAIAAGDP